MLILKRGLSVVLFLPCFILRLLFRYIGLLTILTSGFTTTLILIVARILAFIFLVYPIVILTTEELRMEQQKARERAEKRRLECVARSERREPEVLKGPEPNVREDIENGNGNRAPSKYSYGKGD